MLSPYLVVDALPECDTDSSEDTPQAEPIARLCARTHVLRMPMDKLTLQEYQIFNAIKDTLGEVCRVSVWMRVDALDIEAASAALAADDCWRQNVAHLMTWLYWWV